jgi:hypothetical protein
VVLSVGLQGFAHLLPMPKELPIDRFFHSLAEDQRENAIGVILSGTASDDALGLRTIKAEGGITFAQDEKSAKYGGMPHSAVVAGGVDLILPPEGIAKELVRISRHPYPPGKTRTLKETIGAEDSFPKNGNVKKPEESRCLLGLRCWTISESWRQSTGSAGKLNQLIRISASKGRLILKNMKYPIP